MTAPVDTLTSYGLLREFRGAWQYKFSVDGRWMTADSREDAIEMANRTMRETPKDKLLTDEQRSDKADAALMQSCHALYGRMSIQVMESELLRLDRLVLESQRAGQGEINGNARRSSRRAMSNEAAWAAGEERARLKIYLAERKKAA